MLLSAPPPSAQQLKWVENRKTSCLNPWGEVGKAWGRGGERWGGKVGKGNFKGSGTVIEWQSVWSVGRRKYFLCSEKYRYSEEEEKTFTLHTIFTCTNTVYQVGCFILSNDGQYFDSYPISDTYNNNQSPFFYKFIKISCYILYVL